MAPLEQKRPQVTTNISSSFSQHGRSYSPNPPSYTTEDLLTAKYLQVERIIHWMRTGVAFVSFGISIAVIACTGISLHQYSTSKASPQWVVPLWASNMDLRPSHSVLACGIITTILSLIYLVFAFTPLVSCPLLHCSR